MVVDALKNVASTLQTVALTLHTQTAFLQTIRPSSDGDYNRGPKWAPRIQAAAAVALVCVTFVWATPTLARILGEAGPTILKALSDIYNPPPRQPVKQVSVGDPSPQGTLPANEPGQKKDERSVPQLQPSPPPESPIKPTQDRRPRLEREKRPPVGRIEFMAAKGMGDVQELLQEDPDSRKLFQCLRENHYIYGLSGEPQNFFVPMRGKMSEREFLALSNDCTHLALREVHVPPDWPASKLDEHVDRWSANCGISRKQIEGLSMVHLPESGGKQNLCEVGGVCLMVTTITSCTARAFGDFNLPQTIAKSSGR